ncbi:signal peptidase II [soil metagenome]
MRQRLLAFFAVVLALGLFGCDHASKTLVERQLHASGATVSVVPGVVELRYTENHDTAFSLSHALSTPSKSVLLTTLALVGLGACLFAWWRKRKTATPMEHIGYAMILSGALGNGIDRLLRGYVIDFIHVTHWPVFNVADIAVCVGVGLLVLAQLRRRPAAPAPSIS